MMHFAAPHAPAGPWPARIPFNARYHGWPSNPMPLPVQRSCLAPTRSPNTLRRTGRRVTFALPSRRHDDGSSANSPALQALTGTPIPDLHDGAFQAATHFRHNSRHTTARQNATGRSPPMFGAFQARTEERHNEENRHLGVRPNRDARHTSNAVDCSAPHPQLSSQQPHPFLAPLSLPLVYDVRLPPITLSFLPTSPYTGCGHQHLAVPMHAGKPRRVRLISPDFPWSFDLDFTSRVPRSARHPGTNVFLDGSPDIEPETRVVTCFDILASLHVALQQPLSDVEWGSADEPRRESILRARDRRLRLTQTTTAHPQHAKLSSSSTNSWSSSSNSTIRLTRARNHSILRVDWLGSKVVFAGLVRDTAFARSRLFPGTEELPETWVVRFRSM
ncbi:hypothetical protein HYDPIDRAFT_117687 [Hydnomerulius pinastri MD-312]|uniref:DUF6699 domain-containing protein n=1 Tax=Hydnomerulius pinastri MD-312 TaxID=994086 RepID=A0A0C9W9M4_9AGAM|nr:hypothetical protein HYDPIDRAFT_117687 [Hydnomerulius pinastri MD-312]